MRTDALSVISTDHCAFLFDGQKTLGKDDFSKIPNGGPGLENRLQMIHEFGVRGGRISLNRMVELLATNPARLFGLYPRKGTVAVGSDADLVVFDPEKQVTISAATQHSKVDYNLYEGTTVTGSPEVVLLRGQVLVENDELVASPGHRPVRQAGPLRRGAEARAHGEGVVTEPRAFYDGAWPPTVRQCPAQTGFRPKRTRPVPGTVPSSSRLRHAGESVSTRAAYSRHATHSSRPPRDPDRPHARRLRRQGRRRLLSGLAPVRSGS